MALQLLIVALCIARTQTSDVKYEIDADPEIMIAQESRQYQTIVKPPVRIYKPTGVTNSHRPQYNVDSEESMRSEEAPPERFTYGSNYKRNSKEGMVREAVLRALDRKDNVNKFAQILPILRSMSGSQRVTLASLVANQVSPAGRLPFNVAKMRSMYSDNTTSELMLPVLYDMANMIHKATKPEKERNSITHVAPRITKRSLTLDENVTLDDDPFETSFDELTTTTTTTTNAPKTQNSQTRTRSRTRVKTLQNTSTINKTNLNNTKDTTGNIRDSIKDQSKDRNFTRSLFSTTTTTEGTSSFKPSSTSTVYDNVTMDLVTDSTNQTLAQDFPVAEKLRSINRYVDRKVTNFRRGVPPKSSGVLRRTTAEPALTSAKRRPAPARKPAPTVDGNCELFTNSLCLHSEDYPTDAIMQTIRRNKAAAGALLADFRDPGEGAVDGVTAAQEAKYTVDHYLVSNRRGDTASRDFASAGEAGFMCPSMVKYARPQRARATSGQWKYIVNTGEHTQTLRLEKCLKPKEPCTYLTDNFKSKCVQVYNYHRLLTWDQQNGLHMDIFKVPTCCSCHIEGYSVSFPPLGHRVQETSSEHFPGDEVSAEQGNAAYEAIQQQSIQRPSIKKTPFSLKPLEQFSSIAENHNLIGSGFSNGNLDENDSYNLQGTGLKDSYGNSYFPDSFNQASSIRSVKRPAIGRNPVSASNYDSPTLPSYLEPPSPGSPSYSFIKEPTSKYKITSSSQYKRGAPRPSRRPIRKKISGAPDDLVSSGTTGIETFTSASVESLEDFNDDLEEPDVIINDQTKVTISPKLHSSLSQSTSSTFGPPEKNRPVKSDAIGPNGKRVNYNYHPIIDFFDEEKDDVSLLDREDAVASYEPTVQSEWTPIDHPVSRNTQNNFVKRKKH